MDRTALFQQLAEAKGPAVERRTEPPPSIAPRERALFIAAREAHEALKSAQPLLRRAKIPLVAAAWAPEEGPTDAPLAKRSRSARSAAMEARRASAASAVRRLLAQCRAQQKALRAALLSTAAADASKKGATLPAAVRVQTEGALAVLNQATMRMAQSLAAREAAAARHSEIHRAATALQLPQALLRLGAGRGALQRLSDSEAATTAGKDGTPSAALATKAVLSLTKATLSVVRRRRGFGGVSAEDRSGGGGTTAVAGGGWLEEEVEEDPADDAPSPKGVGKGADSAAGQESAAGQDSAAVATAAWADAQKSATTLSETQQQALAMEGQALEERLGDLAHEVGRAEVTLMELARMQNEISSHLVAQDEKIIGVQVDTSAAFNNVEAGNEDLAQALQFNRDFRWGMLLVFLLLSGTLLFLDAFYP